MLNKTLYNLKVSGCKFYNLQTSSNIGKDVIRIGAVIFCEGLWQDKFYFTITNTDSIGGFSKKGLYSLLGEEGFAGFRRLLIYWRLK